MKRRIWLSGHCIYGMIIVWTFQSFDNASYLKGDNNFDNYYE